MNSVTSYYDLLGISHEADEETILAAIADLRKKDNHHSYASTLDNIESHLADAHKRKAYNDFLKSQQVNFQQVDLLSNDEIAGSSAIYNAKHNPQRDVNVNFHRDTVHTISHHEQRQCANPQGISPPQNRVSRNNFSDKDEHNHSFQNKHYSSNDVAANGFKPVKMANSYFHTTIFNKRFYGRLFSWVILLSLITILAWLGNRAYSRWQVHEQATQAVNVLRTASVDVENFIRRNRYFPKQIPNSSLTSSYYTIEIVDKDIILTFNAQAADGLPNTQLKMLARDVPKIGLTWQCIPAAGFPIEYIPQKCY